MRSDEPVQQSSATRLHMGNGWRVEVLSGAGGKQPAAILLTTPHWRVLLDAGATLNPAQSGRTEPWLAAALAQPLDAVLISHDHVDHIGAAGQLPRDVPVYTTASVATALPQGAAWHELPLQGEVRLEKALAPALRVRTGASGHSLGGVWLHLNDAQDAGSAGLLYSGDVSLESSLFAFDAPPKAELALLDASYGRYDVSQSQCLQTLASLLHKPSILPVPASGRALELVLWLQAQGRRDWSMDDACHQALAAALAMPHEQFPPGVPEQLAQLATMTNALPTLFDPSANVLLVADPQPDGQPSAFVQQWLAQPGADHQILYTGYRPPAAPATATHPAVEEHTLRWNVHPRLSDLAHLLQIIQPRAWLPLFTADISAESLLLTSPNSHD